MMSDCGTQVDLSHTDNDDRSDELLQLREELKLQRAKCHCSSGIVIIFVNI